MKRTWMAFSWPFGHRFGGRRRPHQQHARQAEQVHQDRQHPGHDFRPYWRGGLRQRIWCSISRAVRLNVPYPVEIERREYGDQ